MKYLFLLLISLNAFAQYKIEINPNNQNEAKMRINCQNQSDCDSKLLDWIEKQNYYKGDWNNDVLGSIASKEIENFEGNTEIVYFHPENFSINQVDISSEIQERQIEQIISKKIQCGKSAVKFIAKNNIKKNLSRGQIKQMAKTYSDIFDLLNGGAIDTAIEEMQSVTTDGTIVTEQDKTDIIAFLNGCNASAGQ